MRNILSEEEYCPKIVKPQRETVSISKSVYRRLAAQAPKIASQYEKPEKSKKRHNLIAR